MEYCPLSFLQPTLRPCFVNEFELRCNVRHGWLLKPCFEEEHLKSTPAIEEASLCAFLFREKGVLMDTFE